MPKLPYQKKYSHNEKERLEMLSDFVCDKSISASRIHLSTQRVQQIITGYKGTKLFDKYLLQIETFYSHFLKRIKYKKIYDDFTLSTEISETRQRLERLEKMKEKSILSERDLDLFLSADRMGGSSV